MKRRIGRIILSILPFLVLKPFPAISGEPAPSGSAAALPKSKGSLQSVRSPAEMLRNASLIFERNLGQTDARVRFLTRADGMTSFLTDRENVIVLSRRKSNSPSEQAVVRMKLEGAALPQHFEGLDKAVAVSNYFIGNDPSKWKPGVPTFHKVKASGVYPGIDIVYYGNGKMLEYDFIVAPGADPARIRMSFDGARKLTTDSEGNLLISTKLGTIIHRKPVAWQEINGERLPVSAAYSFHRGKVGFTLGNWDRERALIIDPVLVYSTLLGGSKQDLANAVAVPPGNTGAPGDVYVAGISGSTDFPVKSAVQPRPGGRDDAFVAKFNTDATGATSLIFSTFLGGSNDDWGSGIAVGESGAVYVVGRTSSCGGGAGGFPTTANAFQTDNAGSSDLFITKLAPGGGALLYSTYLGGAQNDGGTEYDSDKVNFESDAIAVEADRYAYVTSLTNSSNFPVTLNAFQQTYGSSIDAVVSKLDTQGSGLSTLVYSTFLGGDRADRGYGIAVGATGVVYVTGTTTGGTFPVRNAYQPGFGGKVDIFISSLATNLSGEASLVYSTYLGGAQDDKGYAIAVDSIGAGYITGQTKSEGLATANAYQEEFVSNGSNEMSFIAKLRPTGATLDYFTYFGGSHQDHGLAIAVDSAFQPYIAGNTTSSDLPLKDPLFPYNGKSAAFVAKLNAGATELLFSTYVSSNGLDIFRGVAVNADGIYAAGRSTGDYPTTPNAFQTVKTGQNTAALSRIDLSQRVPASIAVTGGNNQQAGVNTPFAAALEVRVTDNTGNPLAGVAVTFKSPNSGASAMLGDLISPGSITYGATTDATGHARAHAVANAIAGGPYSVTASLSGIPTPASINLTNTAGAAQTIAFVQQPTDTASGAPVMPAVTVRLMDALNNPIANSAITVSVHGGETPLLGTLTRQTNAGGIAAFDDLKINTAGTYRLQASGGSLTTTSSNFVIKAGSTTSITPVSGGGQSTAAGTTYASQLKALVQDAFGNPIQGAVVTFTAPPGGATVTFGGSGTVNSDVNGIATSPVMTASGATGTFQVNAAASGIPTPAAFSLTIVAGAAFKLGFIQQPTDTAAGATITPPVTVQLQDSFGNPVRTGGVDVGLQEVPVNARIGRRTVITPQPTDSSGLATFATLRIEQAGQYTLLASSSGISSAASNPFIISAALGTGSTITATGGTPQSATVHTPFAQPLEAKVIDASGNPLSGISVTFSSPASGASAVLSAASAVTGVGGSATVTAIANGLSGSYVIVASAAGVTGTATYSLTNVAATPNQIVFVRQPANTQAGVPISPPVVVRLTDAANNGVSGAALTMSLPPGSVLGGTVNATTNQAGEATFDDLRINTTGTYQLTAKSGAISAVSNPFQVFPALASLVISVYEGSSQAAIAGSAYGAPLKASVQDLFGNPLLGVPVTFTAPSSGASVTFSGATTVNTDAGGIATSPLMTANTITGAFTVTATAPSASASAGFTLTNLQPTANQLAYLQHPTDTMAGAIMIPPVTVQVRDSSGVPVRIAGVPVTLQPDVPALRVSALSGAFTRNTDANGIATFADLSGVRSGTYELQANGNNLSSATSSQFEITTGIPAGIVARGGTPQSAIINTTFGAPLQAKVTDSLGNPIAGVPVVFLAPGLGPSGSFSGQTTMTVNTDAQGYAGAVITANSIAGTYGVTASSSAVTGSALFALTNLPAGAGSLTFAQQPNNVQIGQVIAPPVTVQIRDGSGNVMRVAGLPVAVSLSDGTGHLSGTSVQLTDSSGLATFGDLRLDQTGAKRLRASSAQQAPATSNSFQVSPGAASGIVAFSGSPQATTVSHPFPSLLQAQVKDIGGNPVAGVSVTFLAPTSGPSGTFAESSTVTTNGNGFATAPILTANTEPGNFVVTAATAGVGSTAMFVLTNLPQQGSAIVVTPGDLRFTSEIGQPAPAGQTVMITSAGGQSVSWTATSSAPWLTALPVSGTTPRQMTVTVNPTGLAADTYTGNVLITTPGSGVAVVLVTYIISNKPALVVTPPTLVFTTTSNTVRPLAQTLQATSSSRPIQYNATAQVSTPTGGTWLQVTPVQGTTTGTVTVSVNPAGLSNGAYDGSVLFTPTESGVNQVAAPVTLIVGCGQGGCQSQPSIVSVVNAASFQPGGAPRAIMTIFGRDLSDGIYQATTSPLPEQLGPTSVTVNQVPAPLFYASPTQINFQMPSGLGMSNVVVTVTNAAAAGARAARSSPSHGTNLTAVDPGMFITGGTRASALNGDLSVHTSATPIPAGGYVILYLTGEGSVSPPVSDGVAAPWSPLSLITSQVQVTIGGKPAQVTYQGTAPGYAGLAQLNVIVPAGLTPGDQPVFISINGIPSNAGLITAR